MNDRHRALVSNNLWVKDSAPRHQGIDMTPQPQHPGHTKVTGGED